MEYYDYGKRLRQSKYGARGAPAALWNPGRSVGGIDAHTWHYAGSGALFQENTKATPAVADGDAIGASENQGTDSHDIVQATAAAKPTLKLNILNGHPVFRCDGGDNLQGAFTAALSQPFSVFAVAALDAAKVNDNATAYMIDSDDTTNRMILYDTGAGTPDVWGILAGVSLNGGTVDTDWTIWTALFNGASSEFWHDGVSVTSGDAGAHDPDGMTLGARFSGTENWNGDIAEVVIYDANLSNAAKNQVGNYLANKYALSWTNL